MSGSRNFSSTDRAQHRKTTLVVAVILALWGGWSMARGRASTALLTTSAAALLSLLGFFVASFAAVFHRVWMQLARVLGYMNTRVLLSIIFFAMILPVGLLARATGRDRFMRRCNDRPTYWIPRRMTRQTRQGFERGF
jgi:hypothetical protein